MPNSVLHLSIPSLSSYRATHALQTHLVRRLLDLKAAANPLPPSLILTMELLPTFTFGRRQQISRDDKAALSAFGTVIHAQRGGLVTYHGPGQVVGYPLLDLKRLKLVGSGYEKTLM
jgi:lipoyl(octanoyl) transferase 2